jgi:ElaB/YqjD/DUF883 family membrane-anchored ribosome-binding protein
MENLDKIVEELTNESKKIIDNIMSKLKTTETTVEEKTSNIQDNIKNKLIELQKNYEFHIDLLLNDIHEGKIISDKIVSNIRSLFHSMEHIKDINK